MLASVLKRLTCIVFASVMLLSAIAEAGSISTSNVPLHTYAYKKVYTYSSAGGARQGYIDPGDYVIVNKIQSNGWAYGTYPTPRGRVARWFKASDLLVDARSANYTRYAPTAVTNVYTANNYRTSMGSVSKNETITVVGGVGDFRQIIYKLDNNKGYKMGWVPYWDCWNENQIPGRKVTPAPQPSSSASTAKQVQDKITYLYKNVKGYLNTSKYTGSGQCRGFANKVYQTLFPGVDYISGYTNDNYGAINYKGSYQLGRLANFGVNDTAAVKAFFMKAKPGAFVQMGRRYSLNSSKSAPAPHSAIIHSMYSDGVHFYEANTDGKNTIKVTWYSWWALADKNKGFTIYMPNKYVLK